MSKLNSNHKILNRVLAFVLAIVMMAGIMPCEMIASAATVEHSDSVTLTVRYCNIDGTMGAAVEGATVSYTVKDENGNKVAENEIITGIDGCVGVLQSSDFTREKYFLFYTISKDGYAQKTSPTNGLEILRADKNFDIIIHPNMEGMVVTGNPNLIYTENAEHEAIEQDAFSVKKEGEQLGDEYKIEYRYKYYDEITQSWSGWGTWSYDVSNTKVWEESDEFEEGILKLKYSGKYNVQVIVSDRSDYYARTVKTFRVEVKKGIISGIDITAKETLIYNGTEQELIEYTRIDNVEQNKFQLGDVVTYTVTKNGVPYYEKTITVTENELPEIPMAVDAAIYKVSFKVQRGSGYIFEKSDIEVEIDKAANDLEGLTVTPVSVTYDKSLHKLLNVQNSGRYVLKYRLSTESAEGPWGDWKNGIPRKKNAGKYYIEVEISSSENTENVEVVSQKYEAEIKKAEQMLDFNNYENGGELTEAVVLPSGGKEYNFQATSYSEKTVSYSLKDLSGQDVDASMAVINANGTLTVYKPGSICIIATLPENDNYNECNIQFTLNIQAKPESTGEFIKFDYDEILYTLGISADNDRLNVAANNKATITSNDSWSPITFYIPDLPETPVNESDIGLICEAGNRGTREQAVKVVVTDYNKLANALIENDDVLSVGVVATKAEAWGYAEDYAKFVLRISFADFDTPELTYDITGTQGNNGWYTEPVRAVSTDIERYLLAKTLLSQGENLEFNESVSFDDQGTEKRTVFVRDLSTQGIAYIPIIGLAIDTVPPDTAQMRISYSKELNWVQEMGYILGFYNPNVDITFEAFDGGAGIDYFKWKCIKEDGNELEDYNGTLIPVYDDATGMYKAVLTLPKNTEEQLRGRLSFTAFDKAGLSSSKDGNRVVVVDTICPQVQVKYMPVSAEGVHVYDEETNRHYYSEAVKFTIAVNEENFYSEDVEVFVSKNGAAREKLANDKIEWDLTTNEGCFLLAGDGDYVVYLTYADKSNNQMNLEDENHNPILDENGDAVTEYQSEVVTIDTQKPVLGFEHELENKTFKCTVTEHNFRAEDIAVTYDETVAEKPMGEEALTRLLRSAEWRLSETVPDMYFCEIADYNLNDGIYNFTLNYTDIVGHVAEAFTPEKFMVDYEAPSLSSMKITYSEPIKKSVMDTVLGTLTLGFYNPVEENVEITFTAEDEVSGVKYFDWKYDRQEGVSTENLKNDSGRLEAVQNASKKTEYKATLILPKSQVQQLRGNISFTATDCFNHTSEEYADNGYVVVVDSVSPTMTAEYGVADRIVDSTRYYKKNVTATFKVTEANFFAEDVKVSVSKNGGSAYAVSPTWVDKNADEHIGTFTLTGDGRYVIHVEYKDRSNNQMNKMAEYVSAPIVIDTVKPVIDVKYMNSDVKNVLMDSEKNERKYYDSTQTAIITIKERNFNADDVKFALIAKDVTGQALRVDDLCTKSSWTTDSTGDTHTLKITYSGDANYSFDVSYTDLATLEASDYQRDYFTVDKTSPTNVSVSYSNSVLDTVLESLSFGFYKGKVKVTLKATDNISGVNKFEYNCIKAAGVSSVNTEMLNQAITAANIQYSSDHKTGTVSFEIPKVAVGNSSQFNGNMDFTAIDRAENRTNHKDNKRIVVDNISPTAQVTYNKPVNTEGNISYYDGDIQASITVNEANFYAPDFEVMITKDGGTPYGVKPNWTKNSANTSTGTFLITGDGDYFVSASYKDKSSNVMADYKSTQLTIDTKIEAPSITVNGTAETERAFQKEVVPAVSFEDENFDSYEVTLTRTRYDAKDVDVTNEFVGDHVVINAKGGSGSFDEFKELAENDGIYTLTVRMTDKAGHSSEVVNKFTVNRFGSVYEYGDYLVSLIKDGGAYISSVTDDLVITEYNADRLVAGSLNIEITCDGKPLENVMFDVDPPLTSQENVGESGWFQHTYTISKDNFIANGVYKISVSSNDATGNAPENESFEEKKIMFRVDTAAPEITSIVGLEDSIINAKQATVQYTVFDVIGLKSVRVYVDGKLVGEEITDFIEDQNNYEGSFVLNESSSSQHVRIEVEDLSGNITDTDADEFESAYEFNRDVTVSTDSFVRWRANAPLFWGSILGVVVLVIALWLIIAAKRKKKKQDKK